MSTKTSTKQELLLLAIVLVALLGSTYWCLLITKTVSI